MNRYRVRFESSDQRIWEVVVKADGVSEETGLVRFWVKWGPFGLLRFTNNYISSECLISVIQEER